MNDINLSSRLEAREEKLQKENIRLHKYQTRRPAYELVSEKSQQIGSGNLYYIPQRNSTISKDYNINTEYYDKLQTSNASTLRGDVVKSIEVSDKANKVVWQDSCIEACLWTSIVLTFILTPLFGIIMIVILRKLRFNYKFRKLWFGLIWANVAYIIFVIIVIVSVIAAKYAGMMI